MNSESSAYDAPRVAALSPALHSRIDRVWGQSKHTPVHTLLADRKHKLTHAHGVFSHTHQAVDDERKCLVYPLMSGGSLGDRLRLGLAGACAPLTARQRVSIAAGTAKGLAELHVQGIIHRDVKSTNILLDDACSPLVADMGLCRVLAPAATHTTTRRMGTDGYIDPEYSETLELREQSDVYSFGVVILELISNQAAYTEGVNPPGLVGRFRQHLRASRPVSAFGDPRIGWPEWMVTDMGAVAEQCLKLPGSLRPKMRDVARMLDRILLMARAAEVEARAGGATHTVPAVPSAPAKPAPPQNKPVPAAAHAPAAQSQYRPHAQAPAAAPKVAAASHKQNAVMASQPPAAWAVHATQAAPAAPPTQAPAQATGAVQPPNGGGVLLDLARSADTAVRRLHAHVTGDSGVISAASVSGLSGGSGTLLGDGTAEEALHTLRANAADIEATITAALAAHSLPRSSCVGGWDQLVALISSSQTAAKAAAQAQQPAAPPKGGDVTGLEAVIDALRAHAIEANTSSGGRSISGGDALLALADGADVQLAAATHGGVDAIVQTLRMNSSRPTVMTWATWALCELASGSAHSRAAILRLGALETVLSAMETHGQHVGVQEQGCSLLALLAHTLPPDGPLCAAGAEHVLKALQMHGASHAGVAARGCWALGALATVSAQSAAVAQAAGAVQLTHALAAAHVGHSGVQAHALGAREAVLRHVQQR